MGAFFEHITKGLKGTETEKLREVIDNLDFLPLDLEGFEDIVTFNEETKLLTITSKGEGKALLQKIAFPLADLVQIKERVLRSKKDRFPIKPKWKNETLRSREMQKAYLDLQDKLLFDTKETILEQIEKDHAEALALYESTPMRERVRGFQGNYADLKYLLEYVVQC